MSTPEIDILERIVGLITGSNGLVVIVLLLAYALYTKKLVFGWLFDDCQKNLQERIDKAETELDLLRRERQRGGAD